ncbi:MAG: F0F1 ATP synthase subunit gamma [Candidatus Latescibacter sp.]|nr:F0F1 ATP synthase subunit gamma [Candidatus Latescibacter sp.]
MLNLESLKRKIKSADELQSVVKTMKVLAAAAIRQYERAVESLAEYDRTVEMGLQILLQARPESEIILEGTSTGRWGVIIYGSDQGMVGQFNTQIVSHAMKTLRDLQVNPEDLSILVLGERMVGLLEEEGQNIEEHLSFPGTLEGITGVLQEILGIIDRWRMERQVEQIVLFYNKPLSQATYSPQQQYLLEIDPEWVKDLRKREWPSRVLPTFTMEWEQLFAAFIRQYFFVVLYRAFVESLASENASRLSSMQAAEKNIRDLLEELTVQYNQERQNSITSEILDIVAGFEAMTGQKR